MQLYLPTLNEPLSNLILHRLFHIRTFNVANFIFNANQRLQVREIFIICTGKDNIHETWAV